MAKVFAGALAAMKKALRRFNVPFIAGVSVAGPARFRGGWGALYATETARALTAREVGRREIVVSRATWRSRRSKVLQRSGWGSWSTESPRSCRRREATPPVGREVPPESARRRRSPGHR